MIVKAIDRTQPLPPLTQAQVAEFYAKFRTPISRARVFQIEQRALEKLRKRFGKEFFLPAR